MEAAIGFGLSIAGLAAFGGSVLKTLRTFAASYSSADDQVKELSAHLALTTTILNELGTVVQVYQWIVRGRIPELVCRGEGCL